MLKKTDITIILDRSGSMGSTANATVEGLNRFIAEQEKIPGDGCWTLVQFDDPASATGAGEEFPQVVFEARDQKQSPRLGNNDYNPRGCTALIDACCITIDRIGKRLGLLPESERPDGVLVVIVTDGMENASKHFKREDLNSRISHQQSKYNWKFLFFGANQDAIAAGSAYGVARGCSSGYDATAVGTTQLYAGVNRMTRNWKLDGNLTAENLLGPSDKDSKVNVQVNVKT